MNQAAQERREFFRIHFTHPVRYKAFSPSGAPTPVKEARAQNVSQSGILFNTSAPPQLSSLLWLNVDLRTLKICQEIEERVLTHNDGLIGRVVRVEEDEKGYDVGVCFVTQDQRGHRDVQKILEEISE